MITTTFSDEDAECIGFLTNRLATAAGVSYEAAQEMVLRAMGEWYSGTHGTGE